MGGAPAIRRKEHFAGTARLVLRRAHGERSTASPVAPVVRRVDDKLHAPSYARAPPRGGAATALLAMHEGVPPARSSVSPNVRPAPPCVARRARRAVVEGLHVVWRLTPACPFWNVQTAKQTGRQLSPSTERFGYDRGRSRTVSPLEEAATAKRRTTVRKRRTPGSISTRPLPEYGHRSAATSKANAPVP